MKKLLTCFFAIALFTPVAHAADGAVSRVMPSGGGDAKPVTSARNSGVSRSTVRAPQTKNKDVSSVAPNVRGTVSRVFTGAAPKVTGAVAPRSNVVSRSVVTTRGDAIGNVRGERSVTATPSTSGRRAGVGVRPTTTAVGGRAEIGDSGIQTGSNIDASIRNVRGRAATVTAESIEEAKQVLEQTASLNKSCQEQYNECMDQFCAVIDANQKRCSCSSNIAQYAKVESAVKDANNQLNEVAQRIRYVGLSADEIRAIMNETEAEEALSGSTDTSETRSMLEEIEDLIRDPQTATASYSEGASFGLDLNLDFSSDGADMFNLDFLNTDNTSFSNLRGADLYNAAKKRCSTVLTQCKDAGATTTQITGNYDLAIDKDCVAYEQGLNKMNDTLRSNVRSANLMLQKARLAVLQNKNQYDAKGCIAALNTCMTDDMVCGSDYFKCVDPTKRYIDENGEVVLGQDISNITAFMEDYNNASIDRTFLENAQNTNITEGDCNAVAANDGKCVAKYLLSKIGTGAKVTDGGLCRAVLDKCQAYTYQNGTYDKYNDVVINYVQRAMVNIRAAQQQIISDYASSCMTDIAACYNQQVSQLNTWSSGSSLNGIYNVMRGACRNVALTCAFAIFDQDSDYPADTSDDKYITGVSEMFYNSLLCEDGEIYKNGKCVNEKNRVIWNYNNMATGYTGENFDEYFTKNNAYNLPIYSDLSDFAPDAMCFLHHRAWCYRVSDKQLNCVPFGTFTNNSNGSCGSDGNRYDAFPYSKISIPAADVNTIISRGDTNVYLSVASNNDWCTAKSWTLLDENGCTCMSGAMENDGISCTRPAGWTETSSCPAGYTKKEENPGSCYKPNITLREIK